MNTENISCDGSGDPLWKSKRANDAATPETDAALAGCPFCGGEGRTMNTAGVWWCECSLCRAATRGERSGTDAEANWNRRTQGGGGRTAATAFATNEHSRRKAEVLRRIYPAVMPAGKAMRVLGLSRNTFHKLAKDGRFGTVTVEGCKHARYSTGDVLRAAGLE